MEHKNNSVQRIYEPFLDICALLIGVGDYTHPRFASLPATVRDVQTIASVLTDPARCGYPPANVQMLTGEQATAANIRTAFKVLIESTPSESTAFISLHADQPLAPPGESDDDIAHSPLLEYTYGKANAMHKAYACRQGIAPDPQGTTNPTSEVDDRCKVDYAPLFWCGQVNPKPMGGLKMVHLDSMRMLCA